MAAEKDSRLQGMCRRTRLCRFHAEGCCSRGALCNFAHSASELQAPPDLSCTKLCPVLVSVGACSGAACKFAHSKEELRSALARAASARSCRGSSGPAEAPPREDASEARGRRPGAPPRGGHAAAGGGRRTAGRAPAAPRAAWPQAGPATPPQGGGRVEEAKPERKDNLERKTRFHRTKLCQYHLHGRCSKRDKCDFAHGEAELLQARRAAGSACGDTAGQRRKAADASGRCRDNVSTADSGGDGPRGRRPIDAAPFGKLADFELVRTLSDETMCSLLTASTHYRFSSPGSGSDFTACAEEPHEQPSEAGPTEEDGPAELPAAVPPRRPLAAGRWGSEPVVPLLRSQSADEDPVGFGGRAGDGFVTMVKNTFITVYMGTDGEPMAHRRSQSQSTPGRGRAHEPL